MDTSFQPKLLRKIVREVAFDYAIALIIGVIVLVFLPGWLRSIIALCFLTNVIAPFIIDWKPRKSISVNGKAVFISGCDSGFGFGLAQRLDDLGFCVFAGCLFPEGEGANQLKKAASDRLHIVSLDVTKDESVSDAKEYVQKNLKEHSLKLWAVVCNAGINDGSDLMWTDMDTIKRVIDVNTFGVVRVTKAFLPQICKSKGRVVAVASAFGRGTYTGVIPYCMSKHAVVSFCEGLRMEMYRFGVQVVSIEPWFYRTPIINEDATKRYVMKTWEKAPDDVKRMYPDNYIHIKRIQKMLHFSVSENPGEVVSCLQEAVTAEKPKFSYNPGTLFCRTSFWLSERLPKAISDKLVIGVFKSALSKN